MDVGDNIGGCRSADIVSITLDRLEICLAIVEDERLDPERMSDNTYCHPSPFPWHIGAQLCCPPF